MKKTILIPIPISFRITRWNLQLVFIKIQIGNKALEAGILKKKLVKCDSDLSSELSVPGEKTAAEKNWKICIIFFEILYFTWRYLSEFSCYIFLVIKRKQD